jgi:hypothetical protein
MFQVDMDFRGTLFSLLQGPWSALGKGLVLRRVGTAKVASGMSDSAPGSAKGKVQRRYISFPYQHPNPCTPSLSTCVAPSEG